MRLWWPIVWIVACAPIDGDLDGFTSDVDCDDADPFVFPGGNEICDGIDNDCNGVRDDDYAAGGVVWYVDLDGDGFGSAEATIQSCEIVEGYSSSASDCDDDDPGVNPGALELCDARDQDCDGRIDEDPTDAPVWHADWDQDGYGSARLTVRACEVPDGYIADGSDCNDFDLDVFPGSPERCDLIDNDCDGVTDEPDAIDAGMVFQDADGDGSGDPAVSMRSCWVPDGWSASDLDCDDTTRLRAPDNDEVCLDGIDNNCNDLPDQCTVTAWEDVSDAAAVWRAPGSRDYLGVDVKLVGDVDGDGYDDLVGGAWYATVGGQFAAGQAWLIHGGPVGPDPTPQILSTEASIGGATRFGYLGRSVGRVGDMDGDGFDDFALGAYGDNGRRGAVYLVYGSSERLAGAGSSADLPSLSGPTSSEGLGYSIGGGVDMDGDGLDDMAIGSRNFSSSRGAVRLVYGSLERLTGSEGAGDIAAVTYTGPSSWGYLGGEGTLGNGGDFDGDGFGDVAMGAWRASGTTSWTGAAWVAFGDTARPSGTVAVSSLDDAILGETRFGYFGSGTGSVGDVNGDGYDDLGIGCYGCDGVAGRLSVFFGDAARFGSLVESDADVEIVGASRSYLGQYAPTGADYDGDGFSDIAIGASRSGTTFPSQGSVQVLRGEASLGGEYRVDDGDLDATIAGPTERFVYFGRGMGSGDFNGDGVMDLVTGAERAGSGAGMLYLFTGTSL